MRQGQGVEVGKCEKTSGGGEETGLETGFSLDAISPGKLQGPQVQSRLISESLGELPEQWGMEVGTKQGNRQKGETVGTRRLWGREAFQKRVTLSRVPARRSTPPRQRPGAPLYR